jgi:hypothetical protein
MKNLRDYLLIEKAIAYDRTGWQIIGYRNTRNAIPPGHAWVGRSLF